MQQIPSLTADTVAPAHRPLAARRRWRIDTAGYWVISSREKRVGLAARQHQRYQGCAESGIASRLAPKERLGASGLTRTLCDARARASAGRMHGRSRESRLPKGAQPRGRGAGPPCARRWPTRQTAVGSSGQDSRAFGRCSPARLAPAYT